PKSETSLRKHATKRLSTKDGKASGSGIRERAVSEGKGSGSDGDSTSKGSGSGIRERQVSEGKGGSGIRRSPRSEGKGGSGIGRDRSSSSADSRGSGIRAEGKGSGIREQKGGGSGISSGELTNKERDSPSKDLKKRKDTEGIRERLGVTGDEEEMKK